MKSLILNMIFMAGTVGLIKGYPEMTYLSGIAALLQHISEVRKVAPTVSPTFWMAMSVGLAFAFISPFSWWQGILIGLTMRGVIRMLFSPMLNRKSEMNEV